MISIVHLYAKEYGWDRNKILNFPLDEHFLLIDTIRESQRQDLMMQANIAMLPHMEEKKRVEFFDALTYIEKEQPEMNENITLEQTKADIEKAKRQLENM